MIDHMATIILKIWIHGSNLQTIVVLGSCDQKTFFWHTYVQTTFSLTCPEEEVCSSEPSSGH